jgi:hypothetical protein
MTESCSDWFVRPLPIDLFEDVGCMPDRRLHGSELLRASFVWIFSDGPGTTAEIQVGDIILALDGG